MNPLYLPLDALPGPVPGGAPAVCRGEDDWTVLAVTRDEVLIVRLDLDSGLRPRWELLAYVALDLTAPPLDAQGFPTRVDGFDVAAGMLARAMGMDPRGAIFRREGAHWALRNQESVIYFVGGPVPEWAVGVFYSAPALADIALNHPDAARLALAAVTLAKPWENR